MAVAFTPEQQKVIDLRDKNILVSAAAGSGKTAVLVERIISIITDVKRPVDIDRLLVVTFTNAAAAEMRERISRAIDKRLETEPENTHLQRQAALLHNAQITTIDSFCLFMIRNNFNDLGLDPGFRVADEGEITLLKQDVRLEIIEQAYQENRKEFLECVEYFTTGSNDKMLEEYIDRLYEFSMSCPWPEEWLLDRMEDYKISDVIEMHKTPWCRYLMFYIREILSGCRTKLDQACAIAERPEGPYMYGPLLDKEREILDRLIKKEGLSEIYEGMEALRFDRLPVKKDDSVSAVSREKAKQLRNEAKKQLELLRENYFLISPDAAVARMQAAEKPLKALIEVVLKFKQAFDDKKRKENIIDFHDMEHLALNVLLKKDKQGEVQKTSAAEEYRHFYYEILIDEYQDSNLVQELLLNSISGEEEGSYNRFMVGDVKQSIYKFRQARPELFMEKYTSYSEEDADRQRIDLHKNFRSRPEVLKGVNDLFFRIMDRPLGGIRYDDRAALYPGAGFPECKDYDMEFLFIEKDKESKLSAREQEAFAAALKIKQLVREFQVCDQKTGELRNVSYRDIVILLRTTSGWAEDFRRIFEQAGVPAYVTSRTGYFAAVEIREILELLHVVDNPCQDIPLYGTMKSYFGGFTDEEIALIRSRNKTTSVFYDQLKQYNGDCADKVKQFLAFIESCRDKVVYTPVHQLLEEIVLKSGYLYYVAAKPGGEKRQANVEMLLRKAASYEKTSYYGLFHFLRYIEQLERYEVDYGEADVLDENADVVRIMSIHKSKGLEFPVCMIAGISKRFNMQDTSGKLIADMDMGLGADYVDSTLRLQSRTLRKNAVAMKLKLDSLGEELRVLYVAMTRAREKLFLTGMVPDCDKLEDAILQKEDDGASLEEKVPFMTLSSANSYLDFIIPCLPGRFQFTFMRPADLLETEVTGAIDALQNKHRILLSGGDNEIMTNLSEKFKRQYPYSFLSSLYVKTSVSELKKSAMDQLPDESIGEISETSGNRLDKAFTKPMYETEEVIPYIPSFIEEQEGMSGTDRGSAYHKTMELLNFGSVLEADSENREKMIIRQLDKLSAEEKLSEKYRKAVSTSRLDDFFNSRLAYRMSKAEAFGKLYKERPFVIGLPAGRLNKEFPDSEMVLIQGIIDVYFEENGNLIVADYKTDLVNDPGELIKRYKLQLDYYAEALERLTGKRVVEKIIYSFALEKEIMIY